MSNDFELLLAVTLMGGGGGGVRGDVLINKKHPPLNKSKQALA